MLRRGLQLVKLPQLRALSVAAATSTSSETRPVFSTRTRLGGRRGRGGGVSRGEGVRNELLRRHGDALNSEDLETLHDAVDFVEWNSYISHQSLGKVVKMLQASKEEITTLSDRELAMLIYGFGESRCMSATLQLRSRLLSSAVEAIATSGVPLGPEFRCALLEVRLDNGEKVIVSKELEEWQQAGLSEDHAPLLNVIAKAYARNGDVKGVAQVIGHLKSGEGQVPPVLIDHMAYALVVQAGPTAFPHIEKLLSRSTASQCLSAWCNAAEAAAVSRGCAESASAALSRIPVSSGLDRFDENKRVVDILVHLIYQRAPDAEKLLKPYLNLSENGLTLSAEHKSNQTLVVRTFASLAEDDKGISAAASFYALLHPSFHQEDIARRLRRTLAVKASRASSEEEAGEVVAIARKLETCGTLPESESWLLLRLSSSAVLCRLFSSLCADSDAFASFCNRHLRDNIPLRVSFAKRIHASYPSDRKEDGLIAAVEILFCGLINDINERMRCRSEMWRLFERDTSLVLKVLKRLASRESIEGSKLERDVTTSVLQELLLTDDPLSSPIRNLFLSSGEVRLASLYSLGSLVTRLLVRTRKSEERGLQAINLCAQIIALDFSHNIRTKGGLSPSLSYLCNIPLDSRLGIRVFSQLVDALVQIGIGVPADQRKRAEEKLKGKGADEAAQLLAPLEFKKQTMLRWKSSSLEKLEQEYSSFGERGEDSHRNAARGALLGVIMKKRVEEGRTSPVEALPWILAAAAMGKEKSFNPNDLLEAVLRRASSPGAEAAERAAGAEAVAAAVEGRWTRLPVSTVLALAARLLLSADLSLSTRLAQLLQSSAVQITTVHMTELASLLEDLEAEEVERVSAWLRNSFGLRDSHISRLNALVYKKTLENLISSGKLREAIEFSRHVSDLTGSAFGQLKLFDEAIKRGETALLEDVFALVRNLHSRQNALLDFVFALLLQRRNSHAQKIIQAEITSISSAKLMFYCQHALEKERDDVVRSLFLFLTSDGKERASSRDINEMLKKLSRFYVSRKKTDEVKSLLTEAEKNGVLLESELRNLAR